MKGVVVCDLDGVLYLGNHPIPGAAEAIEKIAGLGYEILYCTNNSSRTDEEAAEKIRRVTGLDARPGQVVSSARAAAGLVSPSEGPALVLGGKGVIVALEERGVSLTDDWQQARVVIVGIDLDLTYPRLAAATRAIRGGARLIGTNHDPTFPSRSGLLPGAGAIIAAVETATERKAELAGKPHPPMVRLIAERVGDRPVWVVGDRPDTDLALAEAGGWTKVLVLSGVTSAASGVAPEPDLVLDSIGDLPTRLP